jgi:hypothetical protein
MLEKLGILPQFSNKRSRQSRAPLVASTSKPSIRRHIDVPNG